MWTSLVYTDKNDGRYLGRTLELDVEEPYLVTYVPEGYPFESDVERHDPVSYSAKYPFPAVAGPGCMPTKEEPLGPNDLKVIEGVNPAGLTSSLLAYPTTSGKESTGEITSALVQAVDIGSWLLTNFASIEKAKEGLTEQSIFLTRIPMVDNLPFPSTSSSTTSPATRS